MSPLWNIPGFRYVNTSSTLCAAKPKAGGTSFKAGMTVTKKKFDVETDPQKLVNYLCGGQYKKEGPEIKLKPDEEYPDWLWKLRTTGPAPLHEMDRNTIEYWLRVKELNDAEHKRELRTIGGKLFKWKIRRNYDRMAALKEKSKKWRVSGEL